MKVLTNTESYQTAYSLQQQQLHGLGTVWRAYDARTGVLTTMNITNVPAGSDIAGPSGEFLQIYSNKLWANSTVPKYNLMQWNSSNVFGKVSGTGVGTWYSGTANSKRHRQLGLERDLLTLTSGNMDHRHSMQRTCPSN